MVIHQTVRVAEPVITIDDVIKRMKEALTVLSVPKECFPFVAPTRYMVYRTWILDAQWTCHS